MAFFLTMMALWALLSLRPTGRNGTEIISGYGLPGLLFYDFYYDVWGISYRQL
jgi:hypothetical protein